MPELQSLLTKHYQVPLSLLQLGLTENSPSKVIYFGFATQKKPPLFVIRESRSLEYSQRIQREYQLRSEIYPYLPTALRRTIPWAELLDVSGPVLVEPYLAGQEMPYPQDHKAFCRYLAQVMEWLQAFQAATGPTAGELVDKADCLIDGLSKRLPRHRPWLASLRRHLKALDGIRPCMLHGDFWRGNLRTQGGELRVIDWEFIQAGGTPWFDALLCLVSLACEGGDAQGIFERCFLQPSPFARSIGSCLKGPHEAIAVSLVLVVLELIARDIPNWTELDHLPHYALLRRLMFEEDPLDAIQNALWTN